METCEFFMYFGDQTLVQVIIGIYILHMVGSLFSASSPTFVCGFVYVGYFDWCEMVPHCGLNLHLSDG